MVLNSEGILYEEYFGHFTGDESSSEITNTSLFDLARSVY